MAPLNLFSPCSGVPFFGIISWYEMPFATIQSRMMLTKSYGTFPGPRPFSIARKLLEPSREPPSSVATTFREATERPLAFLPCCAIRCAMPAFTLSRCCCTMSFIVVVAIVLLYSFSSPVRISPLQMITPSSSMSCGVITIPVTFWSK